MLAGLQTGLINSIASPPIGTIALQWHTQVQYGLDLPILYVYGLAAMAEKPFNRLTPEQQVIVEEELRAAVHSADQAARRDHVSAKQALAKQGINWAAPNEEQMQEWLSLAAEATDRLVETGYVSTEMYNKTVALLEEFRKSGG